MAAKTTTFLIYPFHKYPCYDLPSADKLINMFGIEGFKFPASFRGICLPCSAFITCDDLNLHISTSQQQVTTRATQSNNMSKCFTRKSISRQLHIFRPVHYKNKLMGEMTEKLKHDLAETHETKHFQTNTCYMLQNQPTGQIIIKVFAQLL